MKNLSGLFVLFVLIVLVVGFNDPTELPAEDRLWPEGIETEKLDLLAQDRTINQLQENFDIYSELLRREPTSETYRAFVEYYRGRINGSIRSLIKSVRLYPDGEPDGFRGKALELVFERTLIVDSVVRYHIDVETKSGFSFDGSGWLTNNQAWEQPEDTWLINLYLFSTDDNFESLHDEFENYVVPGNIKTIRIKIVERIRGWGSSGDEVLADTVYTDL